MVGDDIAWMRFGKDGRLYAVNPEFGLFGVAPGTGEHTNPNAIRTIEQGNSIFTNVALTDDGDVWWEGLTKETPGAPDRLEGPRLDPRVRRALRHPNSRFCTPVKQCPIIAAEYDDPNGVPISAILFGGRRKTTIPLVYESRDWAHGVFVGATLSSETTAAATGAVGVVRRDPMAMLPFIGYNAGDYVDHWLEIGKQADESKLPKIFHVNWFRRDDEGGSFLWPGFGDNARVLKWVVERLEGTADAVETPIGLVPAPAPLDTTGLDMTARAGRQGPGGQRRGVARHRAPAHPGVVRQVRRHPAHPARRRARHPQDPPRAPDAPGPAGPGAPPTTGRRGSPHVGRMPVPRARLAHAGVISRAAEHGEHRHREEGVPTVEGGLDPVEEGRDLLRVTAPEADGGRRDSAIMPPPRSASSGNTRALEPMSGSTSRPAARSWPRSSRPEKGFGHCVRMTRRSARGPSGSPGCTMAVAQSESMTTTRPPGRSTRANSRIAASGSSRCWSTRSQVTRSTLPSSSGQLVGATVDELGGRRPPRPPGLRDRAHRRVRLDPDRAGRRPPLPRQTAHRVARARADVEHRLPRLRRKPVEGPVAQAHDPRLGGLEVEDLRELAHLLVAPDPDLAALEPARPRGA